MVQRVRHRVIKQIIPSYTERRKRNGNQNGQDYEYTVSSQFLNPDNITLFIKLRFQKRRFKVHSNEEISQTKQCSIVI